MFSEYMKYLRRRLTARKLERHPIAMLFGYLVFLSGTCALGSETIWKNYNPWQVPSLLIATAGSVSTLASGLFVAYFLSRIGKLLNFRRIRQVLVKHGLLNRLFIVAGVSLWVASSAIPTVDDMRPLRLALRGPAESMSGAERILDSLKNMPKHKQDTSLAFYEAVAHFTKESDSWEDPDYIKCIMDSRSYIDSGNPEIRGWARLMTAKSYERTRDETSAARIYRGIVDDPQVDSYFRQDACRGLGSMLARRGEMELAYPWWLQALTIHPTSGVLENLALFHQDENQFLIAGALYEEANEVLGVEIASNAVSRERQATHLINRATFLRKYSTALQSSDPLAAERSEEKAMQLLDEATKVDKYYLDAYWTGAITCLELKRYDRALRYLAEANQVLTDARSTDLDRYRKYGYDEIGKAHTAWLEVRIRFANPELARESLPRSTARRLLDSIPGIEHDPYGACRDWLQRVLSFGYTIDEDLPDVDRMEREGFLNDLGNDHVGL